MLNPENVPEHLKEELIEYQQVIRNNLQKYEENERMIRDYLAGMPKIIDMTETQGGFCKFIRFETEKTDTEHAKEIYFNTGVLLVPGSAFNATEDGWMRLTFAVSKSKLEQGLESLKKGLQ